MEEEEHRARSMPARDRDDFRGLCTTTCKDEKMYEIYLSYSACYLLLLAGSVVLR